MSNLQPKPEHASMMYDEYSAAYAVYPHETPADVVLTCNIAVRDSQNPDIDLIADAALYRFCLVMQLFANIHLTPEHLENILISTETRLPARVKVRTLPLAIK